METTGIIMTQEKDFEFQILKYVGNRKPLNHAQEFVNLGIHTPFELLNGSFSLTDWIKKPNT